MNIRSRTLLVDVAALALGLYWLLCHLPRPVLVLAADLVLFALAVFAYVVFVRLVDSYTEASKRDGRP